MEGDAVAFERPEHAQQRQISFGGGFEQPLHAVWPGTVVYDVRKMGVQGEAKKARRYGLRGLGV